ncbi:hypothetical protein FRC18_004609 [Serendipita sp. 400]|nr:hypothetical protein FRC18_004609 [Serendipita sp. 400]
MVMTVHEQVKSIQCINAVQEPSSLSARSLPSSGCSLPPPTEIRDILAVSVAKYGKGFFLNGADGTERVGGPAQLVAIPCPVETYQNAGMVLAAILSVPMLERT